MNKFTSALIGGGILFLIINFIVKPLIEEKKVNKESILERCKKINLSENAKKNVFSDVCKKMDIDSQKKLSEMLKKGNK